MHDRPLPADLALALRALKDWLEHANVPYSIIGGVAVSLIAEPRATQDIDALAWLDSENWQAFVDAGPSHGYTPRISDPIEFAHRARVLLVRHAPSGISADVLFGSLPFEQEAIARAATLVIGDILLKVTSPEDLIIMKAVAGRPRDIADIESILNAHSQVDMDRIRYWVKQFAEALDRPEISEQVERQVQYRERQ
jgi:hypothetical protein